MIIGYTRPYHDDLTCDEQNIIIKNKSCETIITESHSSAKNRTALNRMMDNLNPGDKIVVAKLFSLADSTRHLVELLEDLNQKNAYLESIKEGIDTSSPKGYFFEDIVKHLVDFQSDVISEKTKKGMNEAKQKGNVPGRPRKSDKNVKQAIMMYQSKKYSLSEIKEETGISKSTLYRYLEN
ncbi:recombinase family protein [Paenibacillus sp. Cedars]|nr:recombinase family protein [Paenibacillus sp. Cedars]AWP25258.1 resolvase [Paenibacillus sp. Cedars]